MKKLFFSIAALFTILACNAQGFVGLGAGYGTNKSAQAEIHAGYNTKALFVQGGYLANISNRADRGAVFNIRVGHTFDLGQVGVQPSVGYGYEYVSADNSSLNKSRFIGSLYLTHDIVYFGQLFVGGNYVNKNEFFTGGIRLLIY